MYVISISTASSTRGRPDKSRVVFWGNERVCVRATPPVRCATNARGGYYVCGWLWTRETQHLPSKKEKEQSQWTSIAMRGRNMCSHEKARENERKKHKSRCNEHVRPLSSLTSQRKPKKKKAPPIFLTSRQCLGALSSFKNLCRKTLLCDVEQTLYKTRLTSKFCVQPCLPFHCFKEALWIR